ncbi:MAG: peptidylprolyl isomerase [Candidatus Contendobacter sp.]|nr:peptidylprolyl isomerase [Candidatus Contendobacter sp.]
MITPHFPMIGLLAALLATPAALASGADEAVLLQVGDITVTAQDLQRDLSLLSDNRRNRALSGPEPLKELLREIYVGKRMLAEAERLGLEQTPTVQARLAAERRRILAEALGKHLQQQVTPADFAALAREHYVAHPDQFLIPAQFKVAHILKRASCDCERAAKQRQIEQVQARLQAGEDFAALAKTESDDTASAAQGGDLGQWLKRDELVTPFADAMVKLEPGQLSGVVETQFGFHVIKLLERQPARQQSFEEVQPSIEQRLRENYGKDQLQQRAATSYQPGAEAKFNDPAVEAFLRGQ